MATGITPAERLRLGSATGAGLSVAQAAFFFALVTATLSWPQVIHLGSVPQNVDSYFSLWRLAWFAHALPVGPSHLFDANIFYPARHTLAFSDAVLLQGVVGAPLLWLGVPVVFVYNLLVLGSFVLCGLGTFLLVRDLTGRADAALLSGLVFAFAATRFDHYFHLELLWAQWMPLALWALHRTLTTGRLGWGLATGAAIAALGLSCIYYVVFFATTLVVLVPVLIVALPHDRRWPVVRALAAGAVVAAAVVAPYALPYATARADLGEREAGLAVLYGAGPKHYLAAMPGSLVYGPLTTWLGTHEKRLFPGAIAMVLALIGLVPGRFLPARLPASARSRFTRATARPRQSAAPEDPRDGGKRCPPEEGSRASIGQPFSLAGSGRFGVVVRVAYFLALMVALDISFGHRGPLFNWLREHVFFYRGLRVPARAGMLVLLFVAVFAGFGVSRLAAWLERTRPRWCAAAVACAGGLMVAEYLMAPLALVPVATRPGDVYAWLREQPPGVVAELPMALPAGPQLQDAQFEYNSTFHWRPLVNGYSGNTPASYDALQKKMIDFPSEDALAALRTAGARYLLVHERLYARERYTAVTRTLDERADLKGYGPFREGEFAVRAYEMLTPAGAVTGDR